MNILGDIVKGVEGFAMGGPVGAAVGFGGALLGDVAGGSKSSGAGGAGDILSELTSLLGGGGGAAADSARTSRACSAAVAVRAAAEPTASWARSRS